MVSCEARLRSGRAAGRGCGRAEGFFPQAKWGGLNRGRGRETGVAAGRELSCKARLRSGWAAGGGGARAEGFFSQAKWGGLNRGPVGGNGFL
jgi:hypothetical protein